MNQQKLCIPYPSITPDSSMTQQSKVPPSALERYGFFGQQSIPQQNYNGQHSAIPFQQSQYSAFVDPPFYSSQQNQHLIPVNQLTSPSILAQNNNLTCSYPNPSPVAKKVVHRMKTACTACRSRKSKCNGQKPCESCKNNGTLCTNVEKQPLKLDAWVPLNNY